MSNENVKNTDKEFLEKMVQHYVNGDKDAAEEYLSQVLTAKANRIFNESKDIEEEDEKKEDETEEKETKTPEKSEKKVVTKDEKDKSVTPAQVLASLKKAHSTAEDKDAFLKKVAKAAGMESVAAGDFSKAAKALHSSGKHSSFMSGK